MARPRSALCERVWDIADCKSLATRKLFPQTTIKLSCMNLIILYRNPCINELSQWSVYCSILASEGQYKILILYLHPALQKLSILFTEKGQLSNCSFALSPKITNEPPKFSMIAQWCAVEIAPIAVACRSVPACPLWPSASSHAPYGLYVQHWFNWWGKRLSPTLQPYILFTRWGSLTQAMKQYRK